jgi:transcriptional regulator with XRE-family HTH domain
MANQTYDLKKKFGERIRRLRKHKDWKQIDLSVESGFGRVFLSNLENGKHEPKLGTIKTLADSFGITMSQLIKGM